MEIFCKGLGFVSVQANPLILIAVVIIIGITIAIFDSFKKEN